MRLKLTLQTHQNTIPINYQHFLSSAVYNYLARSNKNFATDLHNGKHFVDGKNFKFFTFSWLQFPKKQIINSSRVGQPFAEIKIISPEFYWYISSLWSQFVQNFVNELLELGGLRIGQYNFPITRTETLPDVIANQVKQSQQKLSCLSPLVVTTKKEHKGKFAKYYYKPTDNPEEISEKIRQNLINKYKAFFGKEADDTSLKIEFDKDYIASPKSKVLSHYVKQNFDIKIPAIMCPFTATGSAELIKFGYECGFGELNSAGFGMVRTV